MSRRTLAIAGVAGLALLAACGDDLPVTPIADAGTTAVTNPGDVDRGRCRPGDVADVDSRAIYHVVADLEGRRDTLAVRTDRHGGAVDGVPVGDVRISDDDVFLRWEPGQGRTRVIDLCARDADGTVHGSYVQCGGDGCQTWALSGRQVEPLAEAPASGLRQLAEFAGPPEAPWPVIDGSISVNLRVVDDVAYVARYHDGLHIVDLADLGAIRELAHVPIEYPEADAPREIWNDVKVVDGPGGTRYALMASNKVGVVIVDVTEPTAPRIVGHLGTPGSDTSTIRVHTLAVDGGRAYVANSDLGLEIWDIADPARPRWQGEWFSNGGYLHDLYVEGDRAYLNLWERGMEIVDVADPAAPRLLGTFAGYGETTSHSSWVTTTSSGRRVALHGDEQFGAHLRVVDVDEASPTFGTALGEWQTRPEVSIHNVMAMGNLGVIAHYQDGVRVVDLADPVAPRLVAWFNTWPGYSPETGLSFYEGVVGIDLDPARRRIYAVDDRRGLFVLELDRALSP